VLERSKIFKEKRRIYY